MRTICDTHALIWWCLQPDRLGPAARRHIESARADGKLVFCDISYWEIAMLIRKGRLNVDAGVSEFIDLLARACGTAALPITPHIAEAAQDERFRHGDPADRIIGATALVSNSTLVTADRQLRQVAGLRCVW
jgi:PIN domain nuclease of toxin-antitoxin system